MGHSSAVVNQSGASTDELEESARVNLKADLRAVKEASHGVRQTVWSFWNQWVTRGLLDAHRAEGIIIEVATELGVFASAKAEVDAIRAQPYADLFECVASGC